MLKFSDLSMSQKKAIVAIVNHTPSLKTQGTVTLKEIITITQDLAAKRSEGAPKIGYPNWLFKENKVERGLYQLPVPTEAEVSEYNSAANAPKATKKAKSPKKVVVRSKIKTIDPERDRLQSIIGDMDEDYGQSDFEFLEELRANGIDIGVR
jgi:hypothetical protein